MPHAINLIDGLDGLASGIVAITSFFFCLYGAFFNNKFVIFISLALLGANLAFLKYNFYPAKIFMGDTGSLFLGYVIASLAIHRGNPQNLDSPFFIPALILLSLPLMDTALAILRRVSRGQHIFRGDFSHIHHYYIKMGFTQPQVVERFCFITFCLGAISLFVLSCLPRI